jgi:cytochrome P450
MTSAASASPAGDAAVLRLADLPMADSRSAACAILRDAGPVARDSNGWYMITSAEAAEFALRHPDLFSSRQAFDRIGSPLPLVPIAFDPPEHTRYRRILQPFFSRAGIASWLPVVHGLAGELIDDLAGRGECDLVADLAVPLPAQVFLSLFGLPPGDRERLITWKDALHAAAAAMEDGDDTSPPEETVRLGAEFYEYITHHISRRKQADTAAGLLGCLLADTSEQRLSEEEILGLSFLFVLAGLSTVTSALSTAFAILAAQPRMREEITADPAAIPRAVEELLRVDGPVVFVLRVATRDVELGGHVIPAGSHVGISLLAADRDPARHHDPDAIDFRRQEPHLAFGVGPHRCLGSHLARMEMRVVVEEWHRRIPHYELAPGVSPRVAWPAAHIGVPSLPLVFPASGR